MTTLQVHLLMLGLGLIAYLFLAGLLNKRKSQSTRRRRQWWLGAIAGIVVAASPLSRFWREPNDGMELMTQSLLVAAIGLLALLLFALLRYPLRALRNNKRQDDRNHATHSQQASAELTNNTKPIVINADKSGLTAASTQTTQSDSTDVTIDRSKQPTHTPEDDQANTQKLELADIESVVNMQAQGDGTLQLDDAYRQTSAANDNKSIRDSVEADLNDDNHLDFSSAPNDHESLDLSETEELFAEIRQQKTTVDLPGEDELRQAKADATIDELDFDTQLIQDDQKSSGAMNKLIGSHEIIEEAEVMELDEVSLDFGNDLTGEYAHPIKATPSIPIPETLDDAIIAAKATALSLQAQVTNLEQSIVELDDLRDSTIDASNEAAAFNAEQQESQLKQKDALLQSEDEARIAAESVIAAQRALIDQAKRQQAVVNSLLDDERQRMALLQLEVERSRKMARTAANLARRAAIAQQETRDFAKREQTARLKSQESTRKAVSIARNAISALAAEERKRV